MNGSRSSYPSIWALAACVALASAILDTTLSEGARADDRARLEAGKILSASVPRRGTSIWPGRAMGIVPAAPEVVYRAISDVANYHKFVPRIRYASRLGKQRSTGGEYRIEAEFPWPVKRVKVRLRVERGKRGSIHIVTWKMVVGKMASGEDRTGITKYEGAAWIQPHSGGRSMVTYQMLAIPRIVAPDAVMRHGLRKAAVAFIDALRRRVAAQRVARRR